MDGLYVVDNEDGTFALVIKSENGFYECPVVPFVPAEEPDEEPFSADSEEN